MSEELEQVRALQQAQEKDALALDHEQRKLAEEYARAGSRLSTARLELERLARQDEQARAQRERNQLLVAEKEQARFDQEKAVEIARGEFDGLQAQVHAIGEEYSVLRADLAGLDERARAEKTAAARLEAQIQQLTQRREQLAGDLERMGVERARLLTDNIELDHRAQHLIEHTSEATARVDLLTAQETGGREALAALDEALKSLRIDAQTAQEQRSHIELELVRKQSELKYLDETSRKELSAAASEIAAAQEPEAEPVNVEESEQRYQEVRARIEALGPVNPQALEEFHEAQQRYEFLNTQRQDLLDSIRDTEKAIQELDTESRRRFAEAFESINSALQRNVPNPLRRRPRRNAPDRRKQPGRKRHRHHGLAPRQAPAAHRPALRRRKIAHRDGAPNGHLPLHAQPVLHSRRGGRPARRTQHPAPDPPDQGNVSRHPVHRDHPRQAHDGSRPSPLRRDHARTRRLETGEREVRPAPHRRRAPQRHRGPRGGLTLFEQPFDFTRTVQHADDFDAVLKRTIENQKVFKSSDAPSTQVALCRIAE